MFNKRKNVLQSRIKAYSYVDEKRAVNFIKSQFRKGRSGAILDMYSSSTIEIIYPVVYKAVQTLGIPAQFTVYIGLIDVNFGED